jgi:hypothetical protein
MLVNEHQFQGNTCSLEAYMDGLHALIWKELRTGSVITMDSYRRDLQKSYIGALLDIFTSKDSNVTETDVFSVVNADLRLLLKELNATAGKTTNHLNRMHLMDLKTRLKNALESKL